MEISEVSVSSAVKKKSSKKRKRKWYSELWWVACMMDELVMYFHTIKINVC
jgi:hypothetical protein